MARAMAACLFMCVDVHLAGQLHDLSTWLANSNLDGSKMFSLFHFLIFHWSIAAV